MLSIGMEVAGFCPPSLAMSCPHCNQEPCTWATYGPPCTIDGVYEEMPSDSPNNLMRKYAYQTFVRLTNGSLGRGIRVQHPQCVLVGVGQEFPDTNQLYMEHRND